MSVAFEIETEAPTPLSICPRCGRQVRLDGHCECEAVFLAYNYKKPRK
jgi:hypothetical protein